MKKFFIVVLLVFMSVTGVFAQKKRPAPKKPKPIIFAVLNDGKTLEPIAYLEKGKMTPPVNGSDNSDIIAAFNKAYYRQRTVYRLIFGGADAGTVTIKSSDAKAECSANMAQVIAQSAKAKLKGFVMALATDSPASKKASGTRRLPTAAERTQIESLVRAEFTKQKVAASVAKNLRYHNLTAMDVDRDGKAEIVGSFWVEPDKTSRALLFFIADKQSSGKYALGFSEFRLVNQTEVMSGEISSLDDGIYHELLLDVFDTNGDGVGEVFTYVQSFEGAGFNAYRRESGKWVNAFEGSNYHCGY